MRQHTKLLMSSAVVAVALASGAAVLFAQWADYPTQGPRTKDGKIDFAAPPPRTADGKIDFSGLWEPARGGGPGRGAGQGKGQAKGGPAAGTPAAPPPAAAKPSFADNGEPPVAQFFNIGAGFKEGLPPLTPWGAEVRAQRKGGR